MSPRPPQQQRPSLEQRVKDMEEWRDEANDRLGVRFKELDEFRGRVGNLLPALEALAARANGDGHEVAGSSAVSDPQSLGDIAARMTMVEQAIVEIASASLRFPRLSVVGRLLAVEQSRRAIADEWSEPVKSFMGPFLTALEDLGLDDYSVADRFDLASLGADPLTFVVRRYRPDTRRLIYVGFKVVDLEGGAWRLVGSRIVRNGGDTADAESMPAPWRVLRSVAYRLGDGDGLPESPQFILVAGLVNGTLAIPRPSMRELFEEQRGFLVARDASCRTFTSIPEVGAVAREFREAVSASGAADGARTIDREAMDQLLAEAAAEAAKRLEAEDAGASVQA